MKTSITIKETKQTIANKPESYSNYINTLNADMQRADRIGGINLAKACYEAKEHIKIGEWEEFTTIKSYAETLTIKHARVIQLIKGYEVIRDLYNYIHEECDNEDEQKALQEIMEKYTITHYYELRNIDPCTIGAYALDRFITPNMSVAELKKFLSEINANTDEGEQDGDDENGDDEQDNDNENPEIIVKNADEAELLYKTVLQMISEGKTLKIDIDTI
jgi:hypothetical protein